MNSLKYLQDYTSSDSEEETEESDENNKFQEKLPVPEFCDSLRKNKLPLREENHEGKIRNFPHVAGNWATYIYLPLESSIEFLDYFESLLEFFKPLNLKPVEDFHLSLSKTVVLKHHWIQGFTESIKNNIHNISSFKIHLCGLKTFSNEQKTRTFLSLRVDEGEDNLKNLVSRLDNCLKEYNLETFYTNPSFHISLLWCSGDKQNEINSFLNKIPKKISEYGFYMNIAECFCTSGNKNFNFKFQ